LNARRGCLGEGGGPQTKASGGDEQEETKTFQKRYLSPMANPIIAEET